MYKVKKDDSDRIDYLVVSDDDHEDLVYEDNTLEQARRIVQLMNEDENRDWDEIHEIMEREGFYL